LATLYTLFGGCDPGISADRLSRTMAEVTGSRRLRLDWFANATVIWRCVVPQGRLVSRIAHALQVSSGMACLVRLEKSAEGSQVHDCLARFFDQFGPTAAMICSDGTVLALRHGERLWISDGASQLQDPMGWTQFAFARYGADAAYLEQAEIQRQFPKGPANADSW
jgi:hypothetical protein